VFGLKKFSWKAAIAMLVLLIAIGAAAWPSAQFLQVKVGTFLTELDLYRTENVRTSAGERLEFWKKSVGFIADAPVIGHGTGSILDQFRNSVSGIDGASSIASANPHNQVLAVGIQLGFVGIAALLAMWMCHLLLFRGEGLAAWIGLVIVIQNLVGSLFNSELFDFTQGWAYVIGVGVAGGAVMRAGLQPAPNTASSKQPSAPTGAI
jgi:O-antigen ligase